MSQMRGVLTVCPPPPFPGWRSIPVAPGDRTITKKRAHVNHPLPSTDIRTWFSNVEQHATEGVNKILIGNKCDWDDKRTVSTERGQALADELGIPFLEVSAKANINVEKAFFSLAADIKRRIVDSAKTEETKGVDVAQGGSGGGKCC